MSTPATPLVLGPHLAGMRAGLGQAITISEFICALVLVYLEDTASFELFITFGS